MATGVAIDPDSPNRVAVVFSGSSGIHSKFRTQRVFLTTDSGATWNDVSGTDGMVLSATFLICPCIRWHSTSPPVPLP